MFLKGRKRGVSTGITKTGEHSMSGKWNLFVKRHDGKTHTIVVEEARVQVGSITEYCFEL